MLLIALDSEFDNISAMDIKALVYRETRNVLIANLVISCFLTWLTLPKQDVLDLLGGVGSAGFGFYPASILFSSSLTILLGGMLQKKVLAGKLLVDMDVKKNRIIEMLPVSLWALAALIGFFCGFIITPVTLFVLNYTVSTEWTYTQAFILNITYLEILTFVVVPVVVRTAILNVLKEPNSS